MSHFRAVKTVYKDQSCLIAALQDLGFLPDIYDEPQHLYGYRGDRRPEKAEIIVRRCNLHEASNDLGFAWDAESQSYQMIRSEWDSECKRSPISDEHRFVERLQSAYNKNVVHGYAAKNGMAVESGDIGDGRFRYTLSKKQSASRFGSAGRVAIGNK
jgi:Protein of unknown function (DUF1257)